MTRGDDRREVERAGDALGLGDESADKRGGFTVLNRTGTRELERRDEARGEL